MIDFRLADLIQDKATQQLNNQELFHHLIGRCIVTIQIWSANLGSVGVDIFFVLSGYIITKLLLDEEAGTGKISLIGFWIRRSFRIIPPIILFGCTIAVLQFIEVIKSPTYLGAGTFTCNLIECGPYFGHFWSLAVEQQFYIISPLLLIAIKQHRNAFYATVFALFLILSCIDRFKTIGWLNNFSAFSFILAGSLYALSARYRKIVAVLGNFPRTFSYIALLILIPYIKTRYTFSATIINIGLPLFICSIVLLENDTRQFSRQPWLNTGLRYVGTISYSLYLFHAISSWSLNSYLNDAPISLAVSAILLTLFSYHFIERPCIKIGAKLSAAIKGIDAGQKCHQIDHTSSRSS